MDDAAEDIAPHMVRTQEIGRSRRHIHGDSIVRLADDLARLVWGEHRGQQRHHEQCQDDQTTHGSQGVALREPGHRPYRSGARLPLQA